MTEAMWFEPNENCKHLNPEYNLLLIEGSSECSCEGPLGSASTTLGPTSLGQLGGDSE